MIADMSVAPEIARLAETVLLVPPQPAAGPHPGGPEDPDGPRDDDPQGADAAGARLTLGTLARQLRMIAATPERWWGLVRFERDRPVRISVETHPSYHAWLVVLPPGDSGQPRFPRPERGGQIHHDADDPRPGPAGRRDGHGSTARTTTSCAGRCGKSARCWTPRHCTAAAAPAHLLCLAADQQPARRRVNEVLEITGLHGGRRRSGARASPWAWASGWASPPRCSATPPC
jgi:hypothetical protein